MKTADEVFKDLIHALNGTTDALQTPKWKAVEPPRRYNSPIMKIEMLLHFACSVEPFSPERARTSMAYTKFIKQLLRDELVERPTKQQRAEHPGWAYKLTTRGRAYVECLKDIQLPVLTERSETWSVPR